LEDNDKEVTIEDFLNVHMHDFSHEISKKDLRIISFAEARDLLKDNGDRIATNKNGDPMWWWTSDVSFYNKRRAVYTNGEITKSGQYQDTPFGGVRPILELSLSQNE
jgi:hypothetical protein